jgi:serine/threonine protein kinase
MVASNPAFSYHTGAVRWAAPELIIVPEGQTVQCATKSSDIYSLGCIMLHVSLLFTSILSLTQRLQVLYGKLPYWWIKTALQVVKLKFDNQEPIVDPTDIEAHYLEFMRRCWSTSSESRPSVEEVLDFLEEAISNEIVSVST